MKWTITQGVLSQCIPALGETTAIVPDGVTAIDMGAFTDCKELTQVILPEGVTEIRGDSSKKGAFRGCEALESVTLPQSLTFIGNEAFARCPKLKHIEIPEGVTYIGANAFYECGALEKAVIPEGIEEVAYGTFTKCSSLREVRLPASLKRLGGGTARALRGLWLVVAAGVFMGCESLEEIVLPQGLEEIGAGTFDGCVKLQSVQIPESVAAIGARAFRDCRLFKAINLPGKLTVIRAELLSKCEGLEEIHIPEAVQEIENSAFLGCKRIQEAVLPEGIREISAMLFCGCDALESVYVPDSVQQIGAEAFERCRSLRSIHIPAGVPAILESTFCDCESLTEISLPESVKEIGRDAFNGCKKLGSISMPGVTEIGWTAFGGCESLEEVEFPECMEYIGYYAFVKCRSLRRVVMKHPREVNNGAFSECESLEEIVLSPSLMVSKQFIINSLPSKHLIRRDGMLLTKDERCLVEGADINMEECIIPEGVTHIAGGAFRGEYSEQRGLVGYEAMKKISLPSTLTSIGNYAFYCPELTEIEFPAGLRVIGEGALSDCVKLRKITMHDGVESIGAGAFSSCRELEEIHISAGVVEIGRGLFNEKSKVPSHVLPDGIRMIGQEEFDPSGKVDAELVKNGYLAPLLRFFSQRTIAQLIIFQKGKTIEAQIRAAINAGVEKIDFTGVCEKMREEIGSAKGKVFNSATAFVIDYAEHIDASALRAFMAVLEKKKAKANLEALSHAENVREKIAAGDEPAASDAPQHPIEAGLAARIEQAQCGSFAQIRQLARDLRKNGAIPDKLTYADGSAVSDQVFAFIVQSLKQTSRCPQADEVAAAFDQKTWAAALEWIESQEIYRKDSMLVKLLCQYAEGKVIGQLIAKYPKWKVWSDWGRAGKELTYKFDDWVCLSPSREALVYADKLGFLGYYAMLQGSTVEEMRSRLLADFGFDEKGIRIFRAGEAEIEASLNPDASVRLLNRATGKVVKSFPKKGTPNDGEAYAAWKKQLAVVVKSRVKQLKKLFESGGASGYEKWRAQNCSNAIYAALARGLVWGIYDGKEVVGTFRLDEELREVDCGGNVVSIAENAQIGVMHPVDLTEEAMSEWREAFAATAQPLPQLETPVCLPAPDTLQARYMGCMVHPGTLLHGGNGYDEEGGVTAGNETVTVTIINRHDFSGITLYPIIDVSVNEKQFADKRRYNTDVLWMDKLLDPFQKAREAVRTGSLEDVRKMVDIQLIISDNIREMIDLAGQSDRTETAAYLLNLSNEWGVGADDDLSL